ncbi:unnamed protein product [Arabis nemorensis]|uniref:Agenet domain-containing protein n=1 Tax=Arabis nemorensis TaxID=586526 RepID=A0A565CGU6_9BRAS|nr:unnamed protein product [Arabis nemorensis]
MGLIVRKQRLMTLIRVWVPSSLPQGNFLESIPRRIELKIKCRQTEYQYEKEAIVEVTSEDDEAYKGSWYCARVVSLLGDDKYIVEPLRKNRGGDESIRLRDLVEAQNMRPVPPQALSSVACYETGDEGNFLESIPRRIELKIKCRQTEYQYEKEAIVEVTSEDDEAYKGSWYCARVVSLLGDDKYIVEPLRKNRGGDESIRLRDLVEAQNMRPVPPQALSSVACYETGDEVDAWFNKRWWIGRVSKVFGGGSKYLVHFISTGKETIVSHRWTMD